MRAIRVALVIFSLPSSMQAQVRKPTIKVEKDGFPSGHATPEGAACDLARAFMKHDAALFRNTCIPPFGGGGGRKNYEAFLRKMIDAIGKDAKNPTPTPGWPKSIAKLFAARPLSNASGAKAARSAFYFKDVQFVDVGALFNDGHRVLNRTFVIRSSDGLWYAHPLPQSSPTLSIGLDQESPSSLDFKEFYSLVRPAAPSHRKIRNRK